MDVMLLLAAGGSEVLTIISQILEIGMLVCFGFSWPISVYKSWKGKTSEGKSSVFNILIIVGYVFGITSKFLKMNSYMQEASPIAGAIFIFAIVMYFINAALVSANLVLFYIYRENDRKKAKAAATVAAVDCNCDSDCDCNSECNCSDSATDCNCDDNKSECSCTDEKCCK